MNAKPLYRLIASMIQAQANCHASHNVEWLDKWSERLKYIECNILPSGSGVDSGTRFDYEKCTADKIVLVLSFHHMNDSGFYDGWTDHTITVRPSFDGITLSISGRNRRDIKDYLYDLYHHALTLPYTEYYNPDKSSASYAGWSLKPTGI